MACFRLLHDDDDDDSVRGETAVVTSWLSVSVGHGYNADVRMFQIVKCGCRCRYNSHFT